MLKSNEPCNLCNQCEDLKAGLNRQLIGIADARLYNIRFGMNRPVAYGFYKALKFYIKTIDDICKGENCDFCYGSNIENVLEKAKTIIA